MISPLHEIATLRELFSSFNNSDDEFREIVQVLSRVRSLNLEQICIFFHQSDILILIKNCLHYESSLRLQSVAIESLGVLLLRLYVVLHHKAQSISFEAYANSFESQSDLQRLKEDLIDFIFEQLKFIFRSAFDDSLQFSEEGVWEQSPLSRSAERFVSLILQTYHGSEQYFQEHIESLLGTGELNQNHLMLSHQLLLPRLSALRCDLNPVVELMTSTLFDSNNSDSSQLHYLLQLQSRAMRNLSYLTNSHSIQYMNDWMFFLLASLEQNYPHLLAMNAKLILQLYDLSDPDKMKAKPLFLADDGKEKKKKDLTAMSRDHRDSFVLLREWIISWIEEGLMHLMQETLHPVEKIQGAKSVAMVILQFSAVLSLSDETLLVVFRVVCAVFDDFQSFNEEYDLRSVVEEEELLVLLVELQLLLPAAVQFKYPDRPSSWPLHKTIERIGRYYERLWTGLAQDSVSFHSATLRCGRLISRWFVACIRLSLSHENSSTVFGVNDGLLGKDRSAQQASILKLLLVELEKAGYSLTINNHFSRYLHYTLLNCYQATISHLQDTIRFSPLDVRAEVCPHLDLQEGSNQSDFSEESKKEASLVDLLDLPTADSSSSSEDPVSKVRRARNILIALFASQEEGDSKAELEMFRRFQYMREFSSTNSLAEHLRTVLQHKGLSSSSQEVLSITVETVRELWREDMSDLLDWSLMLFDDYLFLFKLFVSAAASRDSSPLLVDHGSQSLCFETMRCLCDFFLLPCRSQYSSLSKEELSCFWQNHALNSSHRDEYLQNANDLLTAITRLVDERLLEENKLTVTANHCNEFLEEKEGNDSFSSPITMMNNDIQQSLKDSLFEVLVVYVLPALQERCFSSSPQLRRSDEKSLRQLVSHVISYSKQIVFYYSQHADRWRLLKQLRSFASQGLLGGGGVLSTPLNALNEMLGLGEFHYDDSKLPDHSSFYLQQLQTIVEALRLVFVYFSKDGDSCGVLMLEDVFQLFIVPLEASFIFTETALFLEQHPAIQHYLRQQRKNSSMYDDEEGEEEGGEDENEEMNYHLLHRSLPAKELFYSLIQLYKAFFMTRLISISDNLSAVTEMRTNLLEDDDDEEDQSESHVTRTRLGKEELRSLCLTSFEPEKATKLISQYFKRLHGIDIDYQREGGGSISSDFFQIRHIILQQQIAGLVTNYINLLFLQSKEHYLPSSSSDHSAVTVTVSSAMGNDVGRRKSRNNSLLLDFNPISVSEANRNNPHPANPALSLSDSLLLSEVENIDRHVNVEQQAGVSRVIHQPSSSQMKNKNYFSQHLSAGLFSRAASPKPLRQHYYYSDHYHAACDVLRASLPPLIISSSTSSSSSEETEEEKSISLSASALLRDVVFDSSELLFSQLSGPCDVITILFATISFDPIKKQLRGKLRAINHSSFKIPFFRIKLLTDANTLFVNPSEHTLTATAANDTVFHLFPSERLHAQKENMGLSAFFLSDSDELLSSEYFPSNAMIEREITLQFNFFASFDLVVRIEYTDLSRNPDIYSSFSQESQQGNQSNQNHNKLDYQRLVPSYLETQQNHNNGDLQIFLNQHDLPLSQQRNHLKYNAVIDLPPHSISMVYLLRSYGSPLCRSLHFWKLQHSHRSEKERKRIALFPVHLLSDHLSSKACRTAQTMIRNYRAVYDLTMDWKLFQEQYHRITDRFSHCCSISLAVNDDDDLSRLNYHEALPLTIMAFLANIQDNLTNLPFNGVSGDLTALGLDCISLHPRLLALGWSLQTVWGDEIAVKVEFEKRKFKLQSSPSSSMLDEQENRIDEVLARVQIRCQESRVLQAVLQDFDNFLRVLSAGTFQIVAEE